MEGQEAQSKWDARDMYTCNLEQLDTLANEVKFLIDLHDFKNDEEYALNIRIYISRLRELYRKMSFLFEEEEKNYIEGMINALKEATDNLDGRLLKSEGMMPEIKSEMEKLHGMLNDKRFRRGLIVPMGRRLSESLIESDEFVE